MIVVQNKMLLKFITLFFHPAAITDSAGVIRECNPEWELYFPQVCRGMNLAEIFGHDQAQAFMDQLKDRDKPVQCRIRLEKNPEARIRLRALRIDEDKRILVLLNEGPAWDKSSGNDLDAASKDQLTGLANRGLLMRTAQKILPGTQASGPFAAVLFLDLDSFKPINDTYGHECGDHVLVILARRMEKVIRSHDLAARIGGDEFVVLLTELQNGMHAAITASRLIKAVTEPISWEDVTLRAGVSVGISIAPTDGQDADELINKADQAMYVAKKSGKNNYSFWNESSYFA